MEFLEKIEQNPYADLYWNIPEVKQGRLNIIGGNGQNFRTPVRVAEYALKTFPLKNVNTVLPDTLQGKVPAAEGVVFLPAIEAGSFSDAAVLLNAMTGVDFNILIGDLSRNNITLKTVAEAVEGLSEVGMNRGEASAVQSSDDRGDVQVLPLLVTRDAVEAVLTGRPERILMRENIIWLVSIPQLQKILRAVYYPKVLTMTQPLVQVAEILHKFSLSYPCKIITLVDGQILVVENGRVVAVPLSSSGFSPLTFWGGELAVRIAALNLYNPQRFVEASVAGIFYNPGAAGPASY